MGFQIGPSFKGVYQLVPPPAVGWGFKSIKRGFKKVGKVAKKGAKAGYKIHKRALKASVKISTAPIKLAAKAGVYALRAASKLAARPIIAIVNKLAGRRAKYLAFQRTGKTAVSLADKKKGGQYALRKVAGAGPIGKLAVKILKFTGGVTAGEGGRQVLGADITADVSGWKKDAAMCGVAPAVVAAAAVSIISATKKIMSALN